MTEKRCEKFTQPRVSIYAVKRERERDVKKLRPCVRIKDIL